MGTLAICRGFKDRCQRGLGKSPGKPEVVEGTEEVGREKTLATNLS
jgi:hypothetical protein